MYTVVLMRSDKTLATVEHSTIANMVAAVYSTRYGSECATFHNGKEITRFCDGMLTSSYAAEETPRIRRILVSDCTFLAETNASK